MHQDQVRVVRHGAQPGRHRCRPGAAAGHGRGHLARDQVIGQQRGRLLPALRHHQHDPVHSRMLLEQLDRVGQQQAATELHKRLRPVGRQSHTVARGHHDRPSLKQGRAGQSYDSPSEAIFVKMILPDGCWSTEVTCTPSVSPIRSRARSTTTMVPSSR